MMPYFQECFYNPSSSYPGGVHAASVIEDARNRVAACIGATDKNDKIIFTSGATESNNLVMQYADINEMTFISSATEHSSICGRYCVPVDSSGRINIFEYIRCMSSLHDQHLISNSGCIVSVLLVNNETGVINDVDAIALINNRLSNEWGIKILTHTDATQAVGKCAVNVKALGVNFMTFAAHKIGGPKGAGVLYASEEVETVPSVFVGGGQEHGMRAGTENVPGIVGLAKAIELKTSPLAIYESQSKIYELEERLVRGILAKGISFKVIGDEPRISGVLSIEFPGVDAKSLVSALGLDGIYISTGSACNSAKFTPSPTLKAMGLEDEAPYIVRISLSAHNTNEEVDSIVDAIRNAIEIINNIRRRENY